MIKHMMQKPPIQYSCYFSRSSNQQEAILLLLKLVPGIKNVLFDFSEPGKIDLEAFMEKNYHFNVLPAR